MLECRGGTDTKDSQALPYKAELLDLLTHMREKCLSERGYTYTSRMVQALLASLSSIWARDGRSANPDDWRSEGRSYLSKAQSHYLLITHLITEYEKRPLQHWGQLCTATEVKVDWHMPSEQEVDFALEIVTVVIQPAVERLEELSGASKPVNKEWRNDFNRYNSLVRAAMAGVASLTAVIQPAEPGEQLSDIG
jgi:proteasome activator subunit 4